MAGKEVIRAVHWFTKDGASKKVSAAKEIIIGATLGLATGLIWQVSGGNKYSGARDGSFGEKSQARRFGSAWFGKERRRVCLW